MHLKRWITSLAALPVVIFLIVKGGLAFVLLIGAVCALSLREYYAIVFPENLKISFFSITGIIFGCLVIGAAAYCPPECLVLLFALNFLGCAMFCVLKKQVDEKILQVMAKQMLSMIYIPLMLAFLVGLRLSENGTVWAFYLLCIVFAGDVGAYYMGSYLGKHKLIPSVSPKKTIEGAAGGIGANIIVGSLINLALPALPWGFAMPMLPWVHALVFFVLAGAVGQFGDLFESMFKRVANVKDSGKILPGHGGILDRIDALLFAVPVAFLFKEIIL
jgi:phosphatidate cytidylyltransferase